MDSLPGKEDNNSLFTSVHGAQDPVATVSWSTAAMGHQLGVTDNAAVCLKPMVPRMLQRQPSWDTL